MNPLLAKYSWQRNNEIISQTIFSYQIPLDQQKISNIKSKWKLDFTIRQGDSSLIGISLPLAPLFPRSRFHIFAGALRFFVLFLPVPPLLSRAWNRLLQAVPGKRSGKREEVIVGLFMKNGGRISVTAVGKQETN